MESVNWLIVTLASLGAFSSQYLVPKVLAYLRGSRPRRLEIVTASGKKFTIEASQLTSEKIAEITGSAPPARASF